MQASDRRHLCRLRHYLCRRPSRRPPPSHHCHRRRPR